MAEMIDKLREYGADVDSAIARCAGSSSLYIKLIGMFLADDGIAGIGEALDDNDLHAAFEAAHGVKGVAGNLSLTPLYDSVCAIVEPLRHEEKADYAALYKNIVDERARLGKVIG